MDFFDMMSEAKTKGLASQEKMWKSINAMYDVLELVEEEHPDEYWKMMRCQHEIFYGKHYNEVFAKYDVSRIRYTNREGVKHSGEYWTKDQILDATKGFVFPPGITEWDKYVAFNVCHADMCQVIDDATIIKLCFQFFFKDEDAPSDGGKIWRYMVAMCCD